MKKLVFLLLATVPAWAQEYEPKYPAPKEPVGITPKAGAEAAEPFRKANTIWIFTTDSAKTALKNAAMLLQQQGFAVDRLDYDLLSVSTKPRGFANSVYDMTILAIWAGGKLKFTGQWRGQAMGMTVNEPAAMTNAASKKAFAEIQKVAMAYNGGRVAYSVNP
jgi:hypothetical protein